MAFRHGVDLFQTNLGPVSVGEIDSAIIAIVGTAPSGPLNALTVVKSEREDAAFGAQVPGFSIPRALAQIRREEPGARVVVINVLNPATHGTAVTAEAVTFVNGKAKLAFPYIGAAPILKHTSGTPTYVAGTDYTIDAYGNITSLDYTKIAANASITATYTKPDFTLITSDVIIGTVDGSTGVRTGFKLLENSYNTLGFEPKILIAPGYSQTTAIVAEMRSWTARLGAVGAVDAPSGTTVAAAKTGRTPAGTINFNVSDKSIILCYPEVKVYDPATDTVVNAPYSSSYAGVMARVDREQGFWKSPSNETLRGVLGLAVQLSGSAFNSGTDTDDLNALGIVTILSEGPTGFRVWGNRGSAYPAVTTPDNFISVYRTAWIMGRSLQITALQYVDRPINRVLIDQIRETGNGYIRQLISAGGLLDGSECVWDEEGSDIPQGKLAYLVRIMPPVPAELIEFTVAIDVSILENLNNA